MSRRIYVACLASYNNGVHHGQWFDLADYADADELRQAISLSVLRTSPFPNVEVVCPCCNGLGKVDGPAVRGAVGGTYSRETCGECHGLGKVPSSEEWAIHDYDDEDNLSRFGEYANLDDLYAHCELIDEHGDAWLAYVSHVGEHYATAEGFEQARMGECDSPEAWAEEHLEESGLLSQVPKELRYYIDFEAYARDQSMGGGVSFVEYGGTTYVFGE